MSLITVHVNRGLSKVGEIRCVPYVHVNRGLSKVGEISRVPIVHVNRGLSKVVKKPVSLKIFFLIRGLSTNLRYGYEDLDQPPLRIFSQRTYLISKMSITEGTYLISKMSITEGTYLISKMSITEGTYLISKMSITEGTYLGHSFFHFDSGPH